VKGSTVYAPLPLVSFAAWLLIVSLLVTVVLPNPTWAPTVRCRLREHRVSGVDASPETKMPAGDVAGNRRDASAPMPALMGFVKFA